MRMIGTIPAAQDAERFSDYLVTRQIENMVEENGAGGGGGNWTVWVEHDDDVDRGKSELTAFLQNPADAKYNSAGQAKKVRTQEEKSEQRRRRQFVDVRTRWGQPRQWAVPLTLGLIIFTLVVSIGTNSIGFVGRPRPKAMDWFTLVPLDKENFTKFWNAQDLANTTQSNVVVHYWLAVMRAGQVWRLITPIFIHHSFFHLLFNLFWLRDLGGMIELRRGTWRLLALVLVCAVLSNLAEFWWELPYLPNFGGMSGVVYGLLGYIWVKGRFQPYLGLNISKESSILMIAWLFLCMTGWLGSIANAAHVAGLITGAAIAYVPYLLLRLKRSTS